jgi:hypothetical protein
MYRNTLFLIIGIFFCFNSTALDLGTKPYYDTLSAGPYIFRDNNKLKARWIDKGRIKSDVITAENFSEFKKKFDFVFDFTDLKVSSPAKPDYAQVYTGVDSLSAISDIHGEYDKYINLLKASGIIDDSLNWKYGKGHLVVLGDAFDRGDKVTQILWHLFGLEKQAEKAGGMVHVILGNHELMIFSNDETYMNDKYRKVEELLQVKFSDLFSSNSVLGNWLRTKPIVITINDILFVHAGISIEMVDRKLRIEQINRGFSDMLAGKEISSDADYEKLIFLNDDKGPIWYRGYFREQDFSENQLDSILSFYRTSHIVVGHTHCEGINPIFKNKIFGIDAGLSIDNEPGQMLIYKNGTFYAGLSTGQRIIL